MSKLNGEPWEYDAGTAELGAVQVEHRAELERAADRIRIIEDALERHGRKLAAGGPLEERIEVLEARAEVTDVNVEQIQELQAAVTNLPIGLDERLTALESDGEVSNPGGRSRLQAAERAKLLAEARLLNARARRHEEEVLLTSEVEERLSQVEEELEALLTQDHAVSRWGRRIEAELERSLKKDELPDRLRGTLIAGAGPSSITGLLRGLVNSVKEIEARLQAVDPDYEGGS